MASKRQLKSVSTEKGPVGPPPKAPAPAEAKRPRGRPPKLRPVAEDAQQVAAPAPTARPDAATLRQVAVDAGRTMPPAAVVRTRRTVLINLKVSEDLAVALARRAEAEGLTQKQIVTHALAAAGLPVDALDLADRSPRRRAA